MGASAPERATAVNFRRRRATRAAAPPQPTEQSGHAREHGFMSAADIAVALGNARREGRTWRCRCPLHGGRSLTLRDGDGGALLAWCFGGCDNLDVLAELQRRRLLEGRTSDYQRPSPQTSQREDVARTASARHLARGAASSR